MTILSNAKPNMQHILDLPDEAIEFLVKISVDNGLIADAYEDSDGEQQEMLDSIFDAYATITEATDGTY